MKTYVKKDFPVSQIRRFLEPGPIVLVSSAYKAEQNIMTLGWHLVMGFTPSLVGCYIWDENHSFSLVRRSKECVINIPTFDLVDEVIGIGNCHGSEVNKFEKFALTPVAGKKVSAPLIAECYANFECKLIDTSLIKKYSLFVFEVGRAGRRFAALSQNASLPWRRRLHDLRPLAELPPQVQTGKSVGPTSLGFCNAAAQMHGPVRHDQLQRRNSRALTPVAHGPGR